MDKKGVLIDNGLSHEPGGFLRWFPSFALRISYCA